MSILIPLAIVVVSGYICYRALRRCEECADEWSAESDLKYSWPSLVQNYYGEGFDNSSGVGGQAELQGFATREAEVPVSDTPRPGDLLQESSGRSGRKKSSPFGDRVYLMDMNALEMREYLLSGMSKTEQDRIFSS